MKQNLKIQWSKLWTNHNIEMTEPLSRMFNTLCSHYNESHRAYHNLTHLEDVLNKLNWAKMQSIPLSSQQFDEIEIALWFHDAVYNPQKPDNEEQSAELFLSFAKKFNLSKDSTKRINGLILLTKHHAQAKTLQETVMIDCDLSILGASPDIFKKYDKDIRMEYNFVPYDAYIRARKAIMSNFVAAEPLFKTKAFYDRYEAQAKKNLNM